MKKPVLILSLALGSGMLFGQSQRLVFIEEYTQASCGPCAQANPTFNALLQQNTTKAVSLKYQVSFPGTDPMYNQNPTEIDNRTNYYGVSGVPDAIQDGYDEQSPGYITQSTIDNQYGTPASFSMKLTHWFNAANDSVFMNCEITCSKNATMGSPKLRVALMEKTVTFTNPPGTNGEKDFYNVMRKMYPTADGTPLTKVWTNGQKKTLSFSGKIPSYVYSKPQLAVVAWIQDDSDKSVEQSVFSATAGTKPNSAPITDFVSDVTNSCNGTISFKDESALFPKSWLWDFGDGTTSTVQNPTHKYYVNGTYTVKLTSTNSVGADQSVKTSYVTVAMSGAAPVGNSVNRCGPGVVNLSASPSGSGTLNWYNSAGTLVNTGTSYSTTITGTTNFYVEEMTTQPVLKVAAPNNTMGTGSNFNTNLLHGEIFDVLRPCTLVSFYVYAGSAGNRTFEILNSARVQIATKTVNVPTGNSRVIVNIPLAVGSGYFLKVASGTVDLYRNSDGATYPYSNSLVSVTQSDAGTAYYYFFYDWEVQENPCASAALPISGVDSCLSGVNNLVLENSFTVFPNPTSGEFAISFHAAQTDNYSVKISNALGQIVYEEKLREFLGEYSKNLNVSANGKGIYLLTISDSKNSAVKKLIVQ